MLAAPAVLFAQTDEIQVYDAVIADQGVFNVMVHSNFTPSGRKTADFPGGIIPNHSVNGAVEWAYGRYACDWMEQGLYFPAYSWPTRSGRDGSAERLLKIRELFVRPHADDHTFFYGVNFEFSVNYKYWEQRRYTSEVRPIIGLHLKPVDIIINPIVDTDWTGGFGNLEFTRASRSCCVQSERRLGGRGGDLLRFWNTSPHGQRTRSQSVPGSLGHDRLTKRKVINIETGVGLGLTASSDKLTFKFMISRDINPKPKP